jgi:hypothetical protein
MVAASGDGGFRECKRLVFFIFLQLVGRDVAGLIAKTVFASRLETRVWHGRDLAPIQTKSILVCWYPPEAKIKAKMIYASSKSDFSKHLKIECGSLTIDYEVSATDMDELDESCVFERVVRC